MYIISQDLFILYATGENVGTTTCGFCNPAAIRYIHQTTPLICISNESLG